MRNFVFRRPFFIWLAVLALLASMLFWRSSEVSTKEEAKLQKLIDSSPKKQRKLKMKSSHELTRQLRWKVVKKIYIADGPLRRVMQLAGSSSELKIVAKKPHLQLQETFYDVHGVVQQELYFKNREGLEFIYVDDGTLMPRGQKAPVAPHDPASLQPMQRFRYFEAQSAIYDFHTHQLLANDVTFWTFTAPGHEIIEEPFIQESDSHGTASIMTIYVSSKDNIKKFSGKDLNVQFKTERGI
jgi:hypothetical protein